MNKLNISAEKWKKIKRNGYFSKQRGRIIKSLIKSESVNIVNQNQLQSSRNVWVEENINQPNDINSSNISPIVNSSNISPIEEVANNINLNDSLVIEAEDKLYFSDEIASWALVHNITQSALKNLLSILKKKLPIENLPADPRTLLKTPREKICNLIDSDNEHYWHYGLKKVLHEALISIENIQAEYSLNVNIDGLPMFRSSTESFWPILVEISELRSAIPPLAVGIFCGRSN